MTSAVHLSPMTLRTSRSGQWPVVLVWVSIYSLDAIPYLFSTLRSTQDREVPMPKAYTYTRLSKEDAVVLLVDHQSGLLSLVQDFSPAEFKNNVLALAEIARYFKLPTILTTSFQDGPNGPLLPELQERHPDAPVIHRPGEINAWDNAEFVKAVKDTARKQLLIAGIVTDVCVEFPTLSA